MMSKLRGLTDLASKIYQILSFLAGLLRGIANIVEVIEELGPDNGGGESKKELALAIIEEAYVFANKYVDLPYEKEDVLSTSEKLIDAVVAFYNKINFFRNSGEEKEEN